MYNNYVNELLHFTADWCQPCKKMKPIIDQFILENPQVQYKSYDAEQDKDFFKVYGVKSVPTLIAIKDKNAIGWHTGIADKNKLESLFK